MESGTFAFTAAETGDYMACYWAPDHKPPMTVSIEFDWKSGVAAKDWSKVARKGQVEVSNIGLVSNCLRISISLILYLCCCFYF